MKTFRITPDARLENDMVEHFARSLCNYKNMFQRLNLKEKSFAAQPFLSFETVLKHEDVGFYVSCLDESETVVKNAIEGTWNRVSVEPCEEPFTKPPTLFSTMGYHYHYTFALRVDRRKTGILNAIFETLHIMGHDDEVYLQTLCYPAHDDWFRGAVEGYEKFQNGHMPQKVQFNKKHVARTGLKLATKAVLGTIEAMVEMTGGEAEKINIDDGERGKILKDGHLRTETIQKTKNEAYDTTIRIGVVCKDKRRAEAIMRSVVLSYRELDGDNRLDENPSDPSKSFKLMKARKRSLSVTRDYFSIPEISRLFMLPSGTIQEMYKIPNISTLEIEVPQRLLDGGMWLGTYERKRQKQKVFFPIDNHDELCLPRIVVGGMGQGKTKGYGANLIVQAVLNGFGGLCIDPAKGELGDEIESILPPEKVIRIRLGERPMSLDWRETKHSSRPKSRLATAVLEFFGSDETGGQTQRFLRAAIMGMKTDKLNELPRIFEDMKYLQSIIEEMPESIHKTTLQSLADYSDGRRRQILDPIYNRLDTILGDEYLGECFNTDEGLDLVELMKQRKAIIIDVPKRDLDIAGVETMVKLLSTKIDLAMTLRPDEDLFPFFVVYDEPHQFLKSTEIWERAVVESRKYRVGMVFMFHEWVQLGRDFRSIIKSALPHYHLYPSSKHNFRDLAEEIYPFTLEDAMKLKTWHAINIVRSGGEQIKPFISLMTPPPSKQT
jgi:hypothetical protein